MNTIVSWIEAHQEDLSTTRPLLRLCSFFSKATVISTPTQLTEEDNDHTTCVGSVTDVLNRMLRCDKGVCHDETENPTEAIGEIKNYLNKRVLPLPGLPV